MIKVAVQTNAYFTENSWLDIFSKNELKDKFQFLFFVTKLDLIELINEVDSVFLFDLSSDIGLTKSKVKMIYVGISDIDFLDSYKFPDSMKIFFSKGFSSVLVAEYSLLTALYMIRNLEFAIRNKRHRLWDQVPFLTDRARSLKEYKIGVLGLGKNGMEIVKVFKKMGCYVSGLSLEKKFNSELDKWYSSRELNSVLSDSDIVIVSLPLREETRNLITMEKLKLMGANSFLINVSRAEVVNEDALISALNLGIIKFAAIDVSSIEDLSQGKWYRMKKNERKNSKLWSTKNLLISPHIAGNANFLVEEIQNDFATKLRDLV